MSYSRLIQMLKNSKDLHNCIQTSLTTSIRFETAFNAITYYFHSFASASAIAMACNSIQCNSSSSDQVICKYDVFVSFRGEDTRNNFTDHLFGALHRKGVVTFRDDIKLKKGEHISIELSQAIEGSQVLIVVFSKNYASSTWCLQELAKIADCIHVRGQTVLPIFYDVNPSEVRKQSGNYEKAFVEHEERIKEDLEKVQRWREALTQVANLCGWDIRDKPQYAEIEKIVTEIRSILGYKFSSLPNDLVGMHSPIEELEKLLLLGSVDGVWVVGICGMGGIGKTTLATVLYERICHQYDACYFIDVSKIYRDHGHQKHLLCQTLNKESLQRYNHSKATNLEKLRALIVLDNVDQIEQLEKLALNREWLGAGSRIIITSRDGHILKEYSVDVVYNVQLLTNDNALKLFCRKAFKCDHIMRDYENLTHDAIEYASGLPLAIKVLGSFLFGRDVFEWRSALARLRENPSKDIMDVLQLSFDGLEKMEKEIFLDIACFFCSENEIYVKEVLDFRGFHPEIGMRILIDKSLITNDNGMIYMHGLLRDLGRSIIREKSPKKPRKWSRLWEYDDIHNVMSDNNMETKNLEAIVMEQYSNKFPETTMRVDALSKMSHLKLLILWNANFSGSLNYLSNEIGYLSWDKYPFQCLPPSFQPDKLVELILPYSNIKQLWEGSKPLHNLRRIDLSHSKNLIKMPNFTEVPNLEGLDLEGCMKLVQIHPSIGILRKLAYLNLKNCKSLISIPNNIFCLSSLEHLNLSGCPKLLHNQLLEIPRYAKHLEKLEINNTTIQRKSTCSSMYKVLKLPFHFFNSQRHEDSIGLFFPSLSRFPCLQYLDLSFCNLLQIPDAIGLLHSLVRLNLGGNKFVTLPSSIKELSKLRLLNLEHCKQLKYLPELPPKVVLPIRSETWFGRYHVGLYIYDCPKLCEMECYCSMAFSWMIQVLKVHMESTLPLGQIDIVIPGFKIPRWFKNQNVGNSISMDPSPIMRDKNWIGVACCVAFVAHDDPTNLSETRKPYIACGFENKRRGSFPHIPIHIGKHLVTLELGHLLLLFFTREEFIDDYVSFITYGTNDLDDIKMATTIEQPQGLHLEVRKCGYRWLFEEDLEQLSKKMVYSNNLSRKCKLLTMD